MAILVCDIMDENGSPVVHLERPDNFNDIQFEHPKWTLVRSFLWQQGWQLEPGKIGEEDEEYYNNLFPFTVNIGTIGSGGRVGTRVITKRCRRRSSEVARTTLGAKLDESGTV